MVLGYPKYIVKFIIYFGYQKRWRGCSRRYIRMTDMEFVPLYMAEDLATLGILVNEDEICKAVKIRKGYRATISKVKAQVFQCQNDQEKCYIVCKRFLIMMATIMQMCDDPNYLHQLYVTDIERVKNLFENLTVSLEKRYLQLAKEKAIAPLLCVKPSLSDLSISSGYTVSEPGTGNITPYLKPSSSASAPSIKAKNPYFKGIFISAVQLYRLLRSPPFGASEKLLIVDIRQQEDFNQCRIELEHGTLINIPGKFIKPGLSAHVLGQNYLTGITLKIWENRDQYTLIVLVDAETEKYNFQGSKIERLRSFLVEWDVNRTYIQDPVVLEGGLREYVEFYPSEVSDSVVYMSQRNSEMDEILVLESVKYPESGSLNTEDRLKLREKDSLIDVRFRVNRDFPEDMETDEYPEQDNQAIAPDDSTVPLSDRLADMTGVYTKSVQTDAAAGDLTNRIRAALEADKTDRLKDARFKKPKPGQSSTESRIAPPVYRDRKPDLSTEEDFPVHGKGFTGIVNLHNNCFISAILQCLKSLPIFKETYVRTNKYKTHARRNNTIMNGLLAKTLRNLWKGTFENHQSYWPHDFMKRLEVINPAYSRHRHEDSFEFYILLFDAISNECAYDLPASKIMMDSERAWYTTLDGRCSFLINSFYHQIKNSKTCCKCHIGTVNFDLESTLMLPVPREETHLQNLVDDYLKETIVDDYCCTECKSKASIVNRRTVVYNPENLVVVLKRYGQFFEGDIRKLNTNVLIPVNNLVFGKETYRLQGFVHHIGSLGGGHYFASVLLEDNVWAVFNDESIRVYSDFEEKIKDLGREATGFFFVRDDQ